MARMTEAGVPTAEILMVVPFHDIDLAGVVWHAHYLKYFENARWALMDHLGFGLPAMLESGFGWPVINLEAKYLRVSRYGDRLRVRAGLIDWESHLTINYLVTDADSGERVARAQTRQVAVDVATGVMQFDTPPALVAAIRRTLAEVAPLAGS